MFTEITNYLRQIALTCTSLARTCPHLPTSRGLEEMAVDLASKAKEIEELYME
jgi:hypothetical protein